MTKKRTSQNITWTLLFELSSFVLKKNNLELHEYVSKYVIQSIL